MMEDDRTPLHEYSGVVIVNVFDKETQRGVFKVFKVKHASGQAHPDPNTIARKAMQAAISSPTELYLHNIALQELLHQ